MLVGYKILYMLLGNLSPVKAPRQGSTLGLLTWLTMNSQVPHYICDIFGLQLQLLEQAALTGVNLLLSHSANQGYCADPQLSIPTTMHQLGNITAVLSRSTLLAPAPFMLEAGGGVQMAGEDAGAWGQCVAVLTWLQVTGPSPLRTTPCAQARVTAGCVC